MAEEKIESKALLQQLHQLTDELENLEEISLELKPAPGEIPRLPGIDVFGTIIPFAGAIGGEKLATKVYDWLH